MDPGFRRDDDPNMSTRILKKLTSFAVFLVALWVAYLYIKVPRQRRPFAKVADTAAKIRIQQGPVGVDLSKQGGEWRVLRGAGLSDPADADRIKDLLASLKEVQIEDEISNHAERASEFEVDAASGTLLSFQDAKGLPLVEGIFGKQAPDVAHIYFRYPDHPNVYLARGLVRGEIGKADPIAWRSRQLVDIPESKMQGILIEGPGFKTDLVRASSEAWTMNGKSVDTGLVNTLVGALAHLRAEDLVDPAAYPKLSYEGLSYARLRVQGADSALELRVGPMDVKSKRYPVSTGKDAGLAWLAPSLVDPLLQKPSAFKTK